MTTSALNCLGGLILLVPTLAARIKEAFGDLKPAEIARAVKKSKGAVTQWLDGTTKSLRADTATAMEAATGYRAAWLVTGKGPKKVVAEVQQGDVFEVVTEDELEMLNNFRSITDKDRHRYAQEMAQRAEELREYLEQVNTVVPLVAARSSAASVSKVARTAVETAQRRVKLPLGRGKH